LDLTLFEQHFHISVKGSDAPLLSMPASDILQAEHMKEALQKGSELVNGIGLEVGVSLFGLAFYGLAATKQIVMSQYNRILDLSLDNLVIQLESHGNYAQVAFKILELRWTDLPTEGRESALREEWARYFADTLNPLIETAASAAGLKPPIIWNQYGARAAYTMDYLQQIVPEGPIRQVIEEDFKLLSSMPGGTFNRRKNPFDHAPRYIDSPYEEGAKIMLRSACCMYYKRENATKCFTCPLLRETERDDCMQQIKAAAKEQSA